MRITEIEINNYKAFYGKHTFSLDSDGKNLMVYGENGSGKSSLFTALKTFFRSAVESVVFEENIFAPASQVNSGYIKVTIKESAQSSKSTVFELHKLASRIISDDTVLIADANRIKGFFDYRSLLNTHLNHEDNVNLFHLLVKDILYHSVNRFTNKELGKEWDSIQNDVFRKRQISSLKQAIKDYMVKFNDGLTEKLQAIELDTNLFMQYFSANVSVKLSLTGISYFDRKTIAGADVTLRIHYCDTPIRKHHLFLNEARLSALAISLYLASIRVNPTRGKLKVLVLDDLLIGLDMSNRLPLLKIIKEHFVEVKPERQFQIVMTTYDRVWFALVHNYFGDTQWKYVEMYAQQLTDQGFEMPVVWHKDGYLEKAIYHLNEKDYKASAVYIRTEFERLVKGICEKKELSVAYKKNPQEIKSDLFWQSIVQQTNIDAELVKQIEIHRGTVMNPLSHDNLEKPEFKGELEHTIDSIKQLGAVAPSLKRVVTVSRLSKELNKLQKQLAKKEQTIQRIRDSQ